MTWQSPTKTLGAAEAEQLAMQLSELSATGLPLAPGLRAAADESPEPRVAQALSAMADSLEQGSDLKSAMLARRSQFPKSLRGYIAAAARAGSFGEVLAQLVEQYRNRRELRTTIRSALAYPLLVLLLVYILVLLASVVLADDFEQMFREFGLALPVSTKIVFWLGGSGKWFIIGAAVAAILGPVLLHRVFGARIWHRLVAAIPVLGPMWNWAGVAEFSRVMAVLVERSIPLNDALRLAGEAVEDANVGQAAQRLAAGADEGQSLSTLLAEQQRLPLSLLSFVRWGEETGALAEAFRGAAELFEGRLQLRASVLRSILPTAAYLVVATVVGLLVVALLSPMLDLIQTLSGAMYAAEEESAGGIDVSLVYLSLLIALGAAPLWIAALVFGRRSAARYRGLLITGWIFFAIGAIALCATISFYFLPVIAVIAVAVFVRFRRSERRSLALAMAVAVERGIPLPNALEAFAVERIDGIGRKSKRAAELIAAGVSLPDALNRCGNPLSREATMAAALGTEFGCLDKTLNAVVQLAEEREADIRWALDKLVYVCAIFFVGAFMLTFMFMKILPTFDELFMEFELELPAMTILIIEAGRLFMKFWYLFGIFAGPLLGGIASLALLGYVGFFPRDLPVIRRFLLCDEGARVMRYLSVVAAQNQPLEHAVQWLAENHPRSGVARRLGKVAVHVEQGGNLWHGLRRYGLIRRSDETVLNAAQKVGNLSWALAEMSASSARRTALRTRAVVNLLFPAVLLFFGICLLFITVAFMLPLVDLSDAMAR